MEQPSETFTCVTMYGLKDGLGPYGTTHLSGPELEGFNSELRDLIYCSTNSRPILRVPDSD